MSMSPTRLAAYCSILLGVTYVLAGITFLLLPARPGDTLKVLFAAGSSPGWYRLFYGELALTGLLGLALIAPASRLIAGAGNAWTEWMGRVAYVAFAVALVQGLRTATLLPGLGQLFLGCGKCTSNLAIQQTVATWLYTSLPLDPLNWIAFGGLGLWILALVLTGLGASRLPRLFLRIGLALALAYWVIVAGSVLREGTLITFGAVAAGIVLGPMWFVWLGLALRTAEARS